MHLPLGMALVERWAACERGKLHWSGVTASYADMGGIVWGARGSRQVSGVARHRYIRSVAPKIRGKAERGTRKNEIVWIRRFGLFERAITIFNRHVCETDDCAW